MNTDLRSILVGTSSLWLALLAAGVLAFRRGPIQSDLACERIVPLYLAGLATQCVHFAEEFVTGFQNRFPALFDLRPWSANTFVLFNLGWLSIWLLAAAGLHKGYRVALFPVWFFAVASVVNGVAHPVLAISARGYFPGLISSPSVGVMGILLWRRLYGLTKTVA